MSAYEATVLSKKPVGYWRLGEKSGSRNAFDTSGNGHVGIYQGGIVFEASGAISGDLDSAINLNGIDAYVEIPSHKDFSQPTSQQGLSIEVWVRLSTFDFEGEDANNFVRRESRATDCLDCSGRMRPVVPSTVS